MLPDRLTVFVSSTILECARERGIARDAIRSINHEAVLFEDLGARPYPPREVYKPRIEASHFFVAIYRESYGWIVPDVGFSGIEDEFRIAAHRGMDRLVYVLRPASNRDPRLAVLVDEAMNSTTVATTVAFYSEPDELYDRIRDDLTSVITSRFAGQAFAEPTLIKPADLLHALVPLAAHRMRRSQVERALLEKLADSHKVMVVGPFGAGKSVLLAQLAEELDWVLVDARGLTTLETIGRCANALRARLQQPAGTFANEHTARAALIDAWQRIDHITLAVDSVQDPYPLWSLLDLDLSDSHQLLLCPRQEMSVARDLKFLLPPMEEDEVRDLVTGIRGQPPQPNELRVLAERGGGSPLYVRFYAQGQAGDASRSLQELELGALALLEPQAREAAAYLALAGRGLSLLELQQLLGNEAESIEALMDILARSSILLRQVRGSVELVHDHLRETILEQLDLTQSKRSFLAARLVDRLSGAGDDLTAFLVAERAGDPSLPERLVDRAAYQVSLRGGGRMAIPVFESKLARARMWGDHEQEAISLIALAQVFQQTGDPVRANEVLSQAHAAAAAAADPEVEVRVAETELEIKLQQAPGVNLVGELLMLREKHLARGNAFDAARITLSLSIEYIDTGAHEKAVPILREALQVFVQFGDQYGIRLAKLNLASALSASPDSRAEALKLTQEISEEVDPSSQPRERAVVCNILNRRLRDIGEFDAAERYAREAIDIGIALGDLRVICINRINLGNDLRAKGLLDEALAQYRMVDTMASGAGLRRLEASANELISSISNEQNKFSLAIVHAQHAAGLARTANDFYTEARAHEERATALESQGETEVAINAYTDAAEAITRIQSHDSWLMTLIARALGLSARQRCPELAVLTLTRLFGHTRGESLQALCDVMPAVTKALPARELVPIAGLAFSAALDGMPRKIERQVVRRALDRLLSIREIPAEQLVGAVVGLLLASDWRGLAISDLTDFAERLTSNLPGVYFKPQQDGAAYWTLRLPLGKGVICTMTQLDDSPWVAAAAMLLVLLLFGLGPAIRDTVIAVKDLPRTEVQVNITSHLELSRHLDPQVSGLGERLESKFVVSRSTDISRESQPPIIVICREDFGERWHPQTNPLSDVHFLFASLLEVITSHLLAQEVEAEILRPKLAALVRQISSHVD